MPCPSRIFTGFRALGFTSNHVPLAVRYHQKHKENYVVTCVGKAFHIYNCSKLGIVSVSNAHLDEISCLAADAFLVYTGCGNVVQAYARGRQVVHTYEGHREPVHLLLPFGQHLLSVDRSSCVRVWDTQSQEVYLELQFDNVSFEVTTVMHPSTYLNKILFGSKQGTLQLWNIRTNKLLYMFQGWGSAVMVVEQAPAIDVVAVGLDSGQIIVHNIKFGETVMRFMQDWGPITAITFRTDGHPIMATGSTVGHIALWNLEDRKLLSQMRDAHSGSVVGMKCLPSEPLMVTSSPDNSLKVWIFDQPDGGGRLLRQRSGHSAPPNQVRYHGNNGHNILSAGQDSTIRSFSTFHDRLNKSLGRASFNKAETKRTGLKRDQHRMPPVTGFASEMSRQSDWDSIAACHRGLRTVTTWNYQRSTMGAHRLEHERFQSDQYRHSTAQCVTISSCGNFAVIGYSSGHVDMYNMQSGIYRGSYGKPKAHDGAVRGVAIDGLNQVTVTVGADTCVKFWNLKKKQLLQTLKLDGQVSRLAIHRESSMLAVAVDDFTVVIVDMDTRRTVRVFSGHTNSITDMTFSPDARWLVTAAMDSSLRTWDLPTGRLVDCFLVDTAVTSLDMSPTGDFLVTTHLDDLGLYLWSNMTLYTHVALRPLPLDFQPEVIQMPSTSRRSQGPLSDEEAEDATVYELSQFKSPEQISDELVTLSLLPHSRWQHLLSLDIIKQRNKPKEPPKIPKSAPFFLPTVAGLEPKFVAVEEDTTAEMSSSRVLASSLQSLTEFGKLLRHNAESDNYGPVMNKLKEMGPSAVDIELRSLAPVGGGSIQLMVYFFRLIDHVLNTNMDFELAQAYLGLFLKLHGDLIASEPELVEAAESLQASQGRAWHNLQNSFNQTLCLVNYLKSATL